MPSRWRSTPAMSKGWMRAALPSLTTVPTLIALLPGFAARLRALAGAADDAELVALRIRQHVPAEAALDDLVADPDRPQRRQPVALGVDIDGVEVDVHAVLAGLRFGHPLQDQLGGPILLGRQQAQVRRLVRLAPVADRRRPEMGQPLGVAAVEDDGDVHRGS